MTSLHPNIELLGKLRGHIPDRLADVEDLFAKTFVWHYFNRHLPDLEGSYEGVDGLRQFFEKLSALTGGTFSLTVKDVKTIGDELLVAHARPAMTLGGDSFETDAAVVWRIVDGKIAEAWDIPALHTTHPKPNTGAESGMR